MVIGQQGDDEPETFTCRLAIVCDGGPHQMSELSSKNPLSSTRVGECRACNRARTAQTDALKYAIRVKVEPFELCKLFYSSFLCIKTYTLVHLTLRGHTDVGN